MWKTLTPILRMIRFRIIPTEQSMLNLAKRRGAGESRSDGW